MLGWGDGGVGGKFSAFFSGDSSLFSQESTFFTKCRNMKENLTLFSGGTAALAGSAAPTAPTDGHPLGRARRAWAECHLTQSLCSVATFARAPHGR